MIRSVASIAGALGIIAAALFVAARLSPAFIADPAAAMRSPQGWLVAAVCVLISLFCGLFTAWVAGRYELQHSTVLGMIVILIAFIGIKAEWWSQPKWVQICFAACAPFSIAVGANFRLAFKKRRR